jgi:hypothetical protein
MNGSVVLVGLALCTLTLSVGATRVMPTTPDKMIPGSEFVGRVEIVKSERLFLERDQRLKSCGYKYVADVVEVLKGDEAQKEFVSEDPLTIGLDYFVYLSSEDSGASLVMSTNSPMLGMLEEERSNRVLCKEKYPYPRAPVSTSLKFETYLPVYDMRAAELEWWISGSITFRDYKEEIDEIWVEAKTLEVKRNGVTKIMEHSEFIKASSALFEGEVAEHPDIYLLKGLMKWDDVKAVLSRLIAEAEQK